MGIMKNYTFACKLSDIPAGSKRKIVVAGKQIMIANIAGICFAVDDACTHLGCSLTKGALNGPVITCACHGGQFDVPTGKVLASPPKKNVSTYPVKITGDDVMIQL